jgi:hypothetical protein
VDSTTAKESKNFSSKCPNMLSFRHIVLDRRLLRRLYFERYRDSHDGSWKEKKRIPTLIFLVHDLTNGDSSSIPAAKRIACS